MASWALARLMLFLATEDGGRVFARGREVSKGEAEGVRW